MSRGTYTTTGANMKNSDQPIVLREGGPRMGGDVHSQEVTSVTKPTISVITATYNAIEVLPNAIRSLQLQDDKDFEWVIADGGSSDGTIDLLNSINDLSCSISSSSDFGIYDALNRAIELCSSDYYIVIGADDTLATNAISEYKKFAAYNHDMVCADILVNGRICKPGKGKKWLNGAMAYVAGHSVGLCIKTSMHKELGLYSKNYPIVADQLFIMNAISRGFNLTVAPFVAGEFSTNGTSNLKYLATATDFYRFQIEMGVNRYLQTLLFFARIIKNFKRI